jgi:acetylornithine deacetylase/succinyl-diaminopimelate desuccinylase-like protein
VRPNVFVLVLALAASVPAFAQQSAANLGGKLVQDAAVKAALAAARADEARTLAEQVEICEVEAPPFKEARRGELYARKFRELGLQNVRVDKAGNVLCERPGSAARPHCVLAAHLDTVFPEGTTVKTTQEGTVIRGPGIGNDCRDLAVVLAVVRALAAGNVQTPGTITFVGNVGEEGLGDLRGVKHIFDEGLKGRVDRFVSIDGTGLGITHISVGSRRYRVTFTGPGGHSYGAFGLVNPIHALGRAMAAIGDFQVPNEPKTTFNVVRIGGGTSVNSIPFEAWMEVDMRSADQPSLQSLDARFHKAVDDAVAAENVRWGSRALSVDKCAGRQPPGRAGPGDVADRAGGGVGDARAGASGGARRRLDRRELPAEPRHPGHHRRRWRPRPRRARPRRVVRHDRFVDGHPCAAADDCPRAELAARGRGARVWVLAAMSRRV